MKNKIKIFILTCFIFFINLEKVYSEQFNFEAKKILIEDNGNILKAKNGVEITADNGIKIIANNFLYNKTNLVLIVEGNVEIYSQRNDLKIFGEKFTYEKNNEKIFSESDVSAILDGKYNLKTQELNYLILEEKIFSNKKSVLTDDLNNTVESDNFYFLIAESIYKSNKLIYKDNIGNKHEINSAMLNTKNNQILGKDLKIDFNNQSFGNNKNEPRLKGNALFVKKDKTIVNKGVFTTCKKNDTCPPWSMSAEEIVHDKLKKTINYKNATLRLYDKPIFYFPKFFHPDPTVKRQSGFLPPAFADGSAGAHLAIPYFKVISNSQDLTFKPRLYSASSFLLNTEYRAVTKNSTHIVDSSFKNKQTNSKNNSSKSHFFLDSKFKDLNISAFENSDVELKIEQVTNDLYLKINDIESPIVNNTSTLNSFINFNGINEDLYFEADFEVYEDTTKINSDRFEYVFPSIKIDKSIPIKKMVIYH